MVRVPRLDDPPNVHRDGAGFWQTGAAPNNQPHTVSDDGDAPMPEATAAATGTSGGTTALGARETPVIYAQPTYGFPETHTVILPFNTYFSIFGNSTNSATDIAFSLVNPLSIMTTAPTHIPIGTTTAMTALADKMITAPSNTVYEANEGLFPMQASQNIPAWWPYWSKMFDSYTVVGSSYDLKMYNMGFKSRDDVIIGYKMETYTTSDTTNKIPGGSHYNDAVTWKGTNWKYLQGNVIEEKSTGRTTTIPTPGTVIYESVPCEESRAVTLKGNYKPYRANHLVQNDQDTKTWHGVGDPPAMKEDLHLMIWNSPLATGQKIRINCMLEIKFIVQFKDLDQYLRYPQYNDAVFNLSVPTDIRQVRY